MYASVLLKGTTMDLFDVVKPPKVNATGIILRKQKPDNCTICGKELHRYPKKDILDTAKAYACTSEHIEYIKVYD